jgi:hypothetical protein
VACRDAVRESLVTYFNGDFAVSVRYPATWKMEQATEDGVFHRRFQPPPSARDQAGASATLFVGPPGRGLSAFAEKYTAGSAGLRVQDVERAGSQGKAYAFASADGAKRSSLILIEEKGRVHGFLVQADNAVFARDAALLDEMERSFTFEKVERYTERRDDELGYALRVPDSWRETRHFKGGGSAVVQYTSPAFAADKEGDTVHASLSLSVEPAPGDGSLEAYYQASRAKLGESFLVLDHEPYPPAGYLDRLRTETPVATSDSKRLYRVSAGRGYTLALEARDDVYPKVARWYDLLAATFRVGSELQKP